MKPRFVPCCVLLATLLALGALPSFAATYDQECFSVDVADPFFEIALTRKSMSKTTFHNGSADMAMGTASSAWQVDYNTIRMDLDEPVQFDFGLQTLDSLMTLNQLSSNTCFDVSAALYDVSVSLGRVIYGACEPTVSSSAHLWLTARLQDGLTVPDLSVNLVGGVSLTCGLEPWAWVSGGLGATTEFIIERSSYRRLKRSLRVTVNASAEAGVFPFGVIWEWNDYLPLGEVVSAYVNY